jgi:hypothetical protein
VKADHPRAIDRYFDYFGNGAGTRSEALDARTRPVHQRPGVERSDFGARDESPRP